MDTLGSGPVAGVDFKRVFEGAPGLFLILRPDVGFTVLGASDAFLRATYTQRGAIVGRGLFEVFAGNSGDAHAVAGMKKLRASLARVMATRAEHAMDIQRYDLQPPKDAAGDSGERYWHPVNFPVLNEHGEILYIIHKVEDVTVRARVDNNLRATDILQSITQGFFALDRSWCFTFVNREAERVMGRSCDQLIGKVIWNEFPGLRGHELEPIYRAAMNARVSGCKTAYYADHARWYEVHTYPSPEGIAVYFRDVSDVRKAEAEQAQLVAASERQRRIYEAALSNTPDLVYIFGLDHRFIYANEALLKLWGKSRQEALGKNCLELGYERSHAEMHDREIEEVIATRKPIRGEVPFTGATGRRFYDYIFVPVVGRDGDVVAVAGTARDTTDRQHAEQAIRTQAERLAEADHAKDEFIATLSHELRNPLAPLRNSLSLLRLAGTDDLVTAPVHEMMGRQINHLVRLVDDLLEMSRISRDALVLRKERVAVGAIVHNAIETSEPLIRAARHDLHVALPEEPMWVEGDPVRLAQVLSNLLNNAATYTEDGGRVAIEAKHNGDHATVSVSDNGPGFAPEALPRMFEMFSRGARSGGRGHGGLGVGLALARRLAEMHGGTLNARSNGPETGSVFTLRLPLAANQAADAPIAEPPLARLAQTRILVVDDNGDAAESLGMVLRLLGADVRVAHDGHQAIEAFGAYGPAVVLLDIGMPGMDGYEVARTLRRRFPDHRAALVALTGWGQAKDRRLSQGAGFDHHLVKPADINALQALLASLAGDGAAGTGSGLSGT